MKVIIPTALALVLAVAGCVGQVAWQPPQDETKFKRDDYECRRDTDQARTSMRRLYILCMESKGYQQRKD
jgi:hypothetical protein